MAAIETAAAIETVTDIRIVAIVERGVFVANVTKVFCKKLEKRFSFFFFF